MCSRIFAWLRDYVHRSVIYFLYADVHGGKNVIQLFLFILLGSSLLIFADERQWQVYVKLALYLFVTSTILSFFSLLVCFVHTLFYNLVVNGTYMLNNLE